MPPKATVTGIRPTNSTKKEATRCRIVSSYIHRYPYRLA